MTKKIKIKTVDDIKNDKHFEDILIKNVSEESDGYSVTRTDGWSFYVYKKHKIVPKIDDTMRFYGRGIGSTVRGLAINGKVIYYKTEDQEDKEHEDWCKEQTKKSIAEFKKNKTKLDKKYNALPEFFRKRIDRFRKANENFRWEYEPYEIFCCEEAVIIADTLKTEKEILKWAKLDYKEQFKTVPISNQHSGNTFGCAVMLARLYLTQPEMIEKVHGSLAPLVGCKAYGCTHE